ncbi:MAG TPA: STAS domain-containing protein [Planctomycetes bacterium]|nr:STAS domain-containing protein [Planctomycetota bacterium]
MERIVAETPNAQLAAKDTAKWVVLRFVVGQDAKAGELNALVDALAELGKGTTKPMCLSFSGLPRPNSQILAVLVNLLAAPDGSQRDVALVAPSREWLDMLDVIGVRANFTVVDSPAAIAGDA